MGFLERIIAKVGVDFLKDFRLKVLNFFKKLAWRRAVDTEEADRQKPIEEISAEIQRLEQAASENTDLEQGILIESQLKELYEKLRNVSHGVDASGV